MISIFEHAKTIHLFVQADYKTVMLPVTLLSYFAAPHTSPIHLARSVVWTFMQLLYFCIANQVFDPEEDSLNKPWRPIPAGRISVRGANILRAAVLPVCIALSWYWGVMPQCIAGTLLGSAYNDFNFGAHWAPRHASVAVMYAVLHSGAAHVACDSCSDELNVNNLFRHTVSALVILTTIQAADFRDAEGDAARGRSTIPLCWPSLARPSMPMLMLVWSVVVCMLSSAQGTFWHAIFTLLGLAIGLRFQYLTTPKHDRRSYLWYNVRAELSTDVLVGS
ncbi:hypothetical protein PENSPDRAFT_712055 [Peniophora sp. CONT]|nr:hypothetical protein PENSPDRAFT_712055 [Peniophora sp. CONT]